MNRQTEYEPDWIDVSNIARELGETFGLRVQVVAEYTADEFVFTCRAYSHKGTPNEVLTFQALTRQKLKSVKSFAATAYLLMFDIYMQADGGGATAARRGPPRDWRGRVKTPARRG